MNRSTRLFTRLNSTESRRFFISLRRSLNTLPQFSTLNNAAHRKFPVPDDPPTASKHRKVLPEELSKNVLVLTCESAAEGGVCHVHVVGTCHVSAESCREVKEVISYLKPEVVFLELCSGRAGALKPRTFKERTISEWIKFSKTKSAIEIAYSWHLLKYARELGVSPGGEFRVAYEEARKYGGRVVLGDRPMQITLKRLRAKFSLWHVIKNIFSLLSAGANQPSLDVLTKMVIADKPLNEWDDVHIALVIEEVHKIFPAAVETIIYERDQYMSSSLGRLARMHSSVVAVVGKGHLPGIKKHWKQPIVVEDLMEIPVKKPSSFTPKILTCAGVAAIISGIYLASKL